MKKVTRKEFLRIAAAAALVCAAASLTGCGQKAMFPPGTGCDSVI